MLLQKTNPMCSTNNDTNNKPSMLVGGEQSDIEKHQYMWVQYRYNAAYTSYLGCVTNRMGEANFDFNALMKPLLLQRTMEQWNSGVVGLESMCIRLQQHVDCARIYTCLHVSTRIYTYLHVSTRVYTCLHV